MSNEADGGTQSTDCCGQRACCPSCSNDSGRGFVAKKGWWRLAVFALGMVMVVGAIAYSLIVRQTDVAGATSNKGTAPPTATAQGIEDLAWVKGLDARFADHDFIFVIMPDGGVAGGKAVQEVARAVTKIEGDGLRVDTLVLGSSDPEFSITAERLAIQKFPAVLAISAGSSGGGAVVTGEITETKLLQAYLMSCGACVPGSSGGCCP